MRASDSPYAAKLPGIPFCWSFSWSQVLICFSQIVLEYLVPALVIVVLQLIYRVWTSVSSLSSTYLASSIASSQLSEKPRVSNVKQNAIMNEFVLFATA